MGPRLCQLALSYIISHHYSYLGHALQLYFSHWMSSLAEISLAEALDKDFPQTAELDKINRSPPLFRAI